MKFLYDRSQPEEPLVPEGYEFEKEVEAALLPILQKYAAKGYNVRDLMYSAHATVFDAGLQILLK